GRRDPRRRDPCAPRPCREASRPARSACAWAPSGSRSRRAWARALSRRGRPRPPSSGGRGEGRRFRAGRDAHGHRVPAGALRVQLEGRALNRRREVDRDLALEVRALGRPPLAPLAANQVAEQIPEAGRAAPRAGAEEVFGVEALGPAERFAPAATAATTALPV